MNTQETVQQRANKMSAKFGSSFVPKTPEEGEFAKKFMTEKLMAYLKGQLTEQYLSDDDFVAKTLQTVYQKIELERLRIEGLKKFDSGSEQTLQQIQSQQTFVNRPENELGLRYVPNVTDEICLAAIKTPLNVSSLEEIQSQQTFSPVETVMNSRFRYETNPVI